MRCLLALLFLCSAAAAQDNALRAHQYALQGQAAIADAQAVQKVRSCQGADTTAAINECTKKLLTRTEADYVSLVRAIGAVIRRPVQGRTPPPQRLPFDEAETAWKTYRDKACGVIFASYGGATMGPSAENNCDITVTISHMHEIRDVYSDYFQ